MGSLLDTLLNQSLVHDVRRDRDGYLLVSKPGQAAAFSDLVREAAEKAGEDYVAFTTSDGRDGYSQMFVLPLDMEDDGRSDTRQRTPAARP